MQHGRTVHAVPEQRGRVALAADAIHFAVWGQRPARTDLRELAGRLGHELCGNGAAVDADVVRARCLSLLAAPEGRAWLSALPFATTADEAHRCLSRALCAIGCGNLPPGCLPALGWAGRSFADALRASGLAAHADALLLAVDATVRLVRHMHADDGPAGDAQPPPKRARH